MHHSERGIGEITSTLIAYREQLEEVYEHRMVQMHYIGIYAMAFVC